MRICRFGDDRLGVIIDGMVHDITHLQTEIRAAAPYTMRGDPVIKALATSGDRFLQEARKIKGVPLNSVKLLSPVARPSKIMAAPTNYAAHIAEMEPARQASNASHTAKIEVDGIFLKSNSSMVGPSEGVPVRFPERRTDHELELVFIIGKEGTDIKMENALDHVAGYCLGLDMVVRGKEDRSFRKSCDGYSVVGPWMVTRDEIPDEGNVSMSLKVNGEVRQRANTRDLIFNVRKLIEFASSFYTLYPGDYFYTGTNEGVARVHPGDVMTLECPQIGSMDVAVRAHEPGRS